MDYGIAGGIAAGHEETKTGHPNKFQLERIASQAHRAESTVNFQGDYWAANPLGV